MTLHDKCYEKAIFLVDKGLVKLTEEMDLFQLTDLLIKLEEEKLHKIELSDQQLTYNDKITSIVPMGTLETIDISVSGDNLFYCNDILTKNSFGLPATADFMFALVSSEELEALNQVIVKQLKNRYASITDNARFVIGIDRSKMQLYNVEESAQSGITGYSKPQPVQASPWTVPQKPNGNSFSGFKFNN